MDGIDPGPPLFGVTRKKLVVIVGTKKALAIAIKNNKTEKRYTLLSERVKGSYRI